jgi:hypothetical protein
MLRFILLFLVSGMSMLSYSQIGIGTSTPEVSALVEVKSSNKGFLLPRLSSHHIQHIHQPAEGLSIYCKDCCNGEGRISIFNGTSWDYLPECIDPPIPVLVSKSAKASYNSDRYVMAFGSDNNLYSWGNDDVSGNSSLGLNVNSLVDKTPTPVINPTNIEFAQVATGHHGVTIALSNEGYVYGTGLTRRGAGNPGDPKVFTKVQLAPSDPKARLIGVCEGGAVCIGQNDKSYIWGYGNEDNTKYFGDWNSNTPEERSLPNGITSQNVIAIGGSYHFLAIATSTKIYFTGETVIGIDAKGTWFEHPATFKGIKDFKVGRNILVIHDEDGYHTITNATDMNSVDVSAIPEPINDILSDGIHQNVFAVTDYKIYYKAHPTDMIGATVVNAPANHRIIGFAPVKIEFNWCMVLLENETNGDILYQGFRTGSRTNIHIGNFQLNTISDIGLDLSNIPAGVTLHW